MTLRELAVAAARELPPNPPFAEARRRADAIGMFVALANPARILAILDAGDALLTMVNRPVTRDEFATLLAAWEAATR